MKLSVVTINYNNYVGLHKTISSVVAQTCHDFEWIVIDGGSTDGSKDLIEQNKRLFITILSKKLTIQLKLILMTGVYLS